MSKSELAAELGVSRAYISMIASGKRKPSQEFVNKLERVAVNELNVEGTSNPSWGINSVSGGFDPHPLPPKLMLA